MEDIRVKDFLVKKEVMVCYIYGITKHDDGTIKLVHYYRKSENGDDISKDWHCGVSEFAEYLINGERIAYAGVIKETNGNETMINPSLVTVRTNNDKPILTTASDDTESNNLLNLPEIEYPKKRKTHIQ